MVTHSSEKIETPPSHSNTTPIFTQTQNFSNKWSTISSHSFSSTGNSLITSTATAVQNTQPISSTIYYFSQTQSSTLGYEKSASKENLKITIISFFSCLGFVILIVLFVIYVFKKKNKKNRNAVGRRNMIYRNPLYGDHPRSESSETDIEETSV